MRVYKSSYTFCFSQKVIFLLIPILTIIAVLIADFQFKNSLKSKTLDIDSLIKEMEELSSKA